MSRALKGVERADEAVYLSHGGEQRDLSHPLEVIDFCFLHAHVIENGDANAGPQRRPRAKTATSSKDQ